MGLYNIDNKPRYLSTLLLVLFFELNGEIFWKQCSAIYLKKTKRFVREKHSVRFRMIRKDESSRYLQSQPIWLQGRYTTTLQPNIFWVKYCTLSGINTCKKH